MIEERVKEWTRQWQADGYQRGLEAGIEKGIEAGIEKGIEAGIEKGVSALRRALKGQMELKFGPLPSEYLQRLEAASAEQLETWSQQILRFDSIDQLFAASNS